MFKYLFRFVGILTAMSLIVFIAEKMEVFVEKERSSYFLYEPNIGINQKHFSMIIKYFGFKKTKNFIKKYDNEYRVLRKLNDDNFIREIAEQCLGKHLDFNLNPSKLIIIQRYKKYRYSIVTFVGELSGNGSCLLDKFIVNIQNTKLEYINNEKKYLETLLSGQEGTIRDTLLDKISLLESLQILYSSGYKAYDYWKISPQESEDIALRSSILFSLLIVVTSLLLIKLIKD